MKQLSLYEIIMLTHSSFQFNICTAHVNPPIDMFVRNANITMGRRVERTNSRTEKKSSQSLFKIEMYNTWYITFKSLKIIFCLPKMRLATCWTNDEEEDAPEDDLHQLLEEVDFSILGMTGIFSWKLCQNTAPMAAVHSNLIPCSTCSGLTLK